MTGPIRLMGIGAAALEWSADALCAQVDTEIFFPDKGNSSSRREAKAICASCPVREACLEYAIANREKFGIWGGMSVDERFAIIAARSTAVQAQPTTHPRVDEQRADGISTPKPKEKEISVPEPQPEATAQDIPAAPAVPAARAIERAEARAQVGAGWEKQVELAFDVVAEVIEASTGKYPAVVETAQAALRGLAIWREAIDVQTKNAGRLARIRELEQELATLTGQIEATEPKRQKRKNPERHEFKCQKCNRRIGARGALTIHERTCKASAA